MTFDKQFWDQLDKDIPEWMSEEEARFLVENIQGRQYLEIGVAYGKSLRVVRHHFPEMRVRGIDLINHGVDKKVYGVEIEYGDANKIAEETGLGEVVIGKNLDTLFIDGDHTYKGCLSDFVHWYNKVKPGGRIIFHDYQRDNNHIGVTQCVDAIKPMLLDFKQARYICAGTKPN